ncbi:MAG: hypothetical protein AAF490_32940 [Chloroflexota bacterium]
MDSKKFYAHIEQMPLDDFLEWFKDKTESAWADIQTNSLADFKARGVGGTQWRPNTKWLTGMTPKEIDSAEKKWNILFPPDYRRFLELLGAPDQNMQRAHWTDEGMIFSDAPSFFNWNQDDSFIEDALAWPLEELLFDVQNDLWFNGWGKRPSNQEDQFETVRSLVKNAPPLIPIIGHRYLLGKPTQVNNPIFSVYQSDIIIYGMNLKKFLLVEFAQLLAINHEQAYVNAVSDYSREDILSIPFWGELIEENPVDYEE